MIVAIDVIVIIVKKNTKEYEELKELKENEECFTDVRETLDNDDFEDKYST